MSHDDQVTAVFTRRRAVLGLIAYIVIAVIIWLVYQ